MILDEVEGWSTRDLSAGEAGTRAWFFVRESERRGQANPAP